MTSYIVVSLAGSLDFGGALKGSTRDLQTGL